MPDEMLLFLPTIIMSDYSVFSEQEQEQSKLTEFELDPPEHEIYASISFLSKYLNSSEDWKGILPTQWSFLHQYYQIRRTLFSSETRPRLAIAYNDEVEGLRTKKIAQGQRVILNLLELGPKVRSIIEHCQQEMAKCCEVDERRNRYAKGMLNAESAISKAAEAFKVWMISALGTK